MSIVALRERRTAAGQEVKKLADKITADGKSLTPEDRANWEKVNKDYNDLTEQLNVAERSAAIATDLARPAGDTHIGREDRTGVKGGDGASAEVTEEHRALALQSWVRYGRDQYISERHNEACRRTGFNPARPELVIPLLSTEAHRALRSQFLATPQDRRMSTQYEARTLSGVSGGAGAYTIPPETLLRQLEINMLAFGGVREVADNIRTTTGERISWPTSDDTTNEAIMLGENVQVAPSAGGKGQGVDPTFSKVYWDAYKFSSQAVLIPYELLQDSALDVASILGEMLGVRIARGTNRKYTVGTGADQPKGIVTASSPFTAASDAIVADDIHKLVHAVDPAYRLGASFMMHDSILLLVRLLKDANGQYLWQPSFQVGLQQGIPERLLTYTITINQHMASTPTVSGNQTIVFGQLNRYKIRTVGEARVYRLQERYRDTDQDGFMVLLREDGNLLTAGTPPLKVLTHP